MVKQARGEEDREKTSYSRQRTAHCVHCGLLAGDGMLERCVSCRSHFCQRCAHRWNGKRFCSRACAELFFFGDEDD